MDSTLWCCFTYSSTFIHLLYTQADCILLVALAEHGPTTSQVWCAHLQYASVDGACSLADPQPSADNIDESAEVNTIAQE